MFKFESGYKGSDSLKTSVAGQEILPTPLKNWKVDYYSFLEFTFMNDEPCVVEINGEPIYLRAEQGFEATPDRPITSFKILNDGIHYNWMGTF